MFFYFIFNVACFFCKKRDSISHRNLCFWINLAGVHESDILDYILKKQYPRYFEARMKLISRPVSWDLLKKYSDIAKYYNDHEYYANLIGSFCEINNPPMIKFAEFVGSGNGNFSLNSYRKVCTYSDMFFFEKVYKANSDDLYKLIFFHKFIMPLTGNLIKTPACKIYQGKFGSIVHFDWVDCADNFANADVLATYRDFEHAAKNIKIINISINDIFCDFTRDPSYKNALECGVRWLNKEKSVEDVNLLFRVQKILMSYPSDERFFAHGDLGQCNYTAEGVFLDFDRCGLYPYGYDLAYMLSKANFKEISPLTQIIITEMDDCTFFNQLSLLFFSFVFFSRRKNKHSNNRLLSILWSELSRKAIRL